MNYQNYLEWTGLSGIYLRNYSQGDRYRTFKSAVSAAGLTTLIVGEFLQDNRNQRLDITDWRTHSVPEAGGDKRIRIQWTAEALETIGAADVAEAVRHAKSVSPFDDLMKADGLTDFDKALESGKPQELMNFFQDSLSRVVSGAGPIPEDESEASKAAGRSTTHGAEAWKQLEQKLQAYVDRHRDELQADIDKHGDPRTQPGFSSKNRMRELDRMRTDLFRRESLLEEVTKLQQLMRDLRKRIGDAVQPNKALAKRIASPKRHLLKTLSLVRKESAKISVPEVENCLQEAERFLQQHAAILGERPIGNSAQEQRLAALGDYEQSVEFGQTRIHWEMPRGFDVGWNHFELELTLDKKPQPAAIDALLDVAERTARHINRLSEQWKQELIEHFQDQSGAMSDWELEGAELDADGQVTEASILELAGNGRIHLMAYDPDGQEIECRVSFPIEWDPEHGFDMPWDDLPEISSEDANRVILPPNVRFVDCGPAITDADCQRLEHEFGVTLPAPYRSFLTQTNGGIPHPNHLTLRVEGTLMPYDIEYFYSLGTTGQDASTTDKPLPAERTLQSMLRLIAQHQMHQVLLPLARVRLYSLWGAGDGFQDHLFLVLTGKRAGRVILFETDPGQEFSGYRRASEAERLRALHDRIQYSRQVASSLNGLFAKIQPFPNLEMPDWLRMIHQNDQTGFMQWLEKGGSLNEQHAGYGDDVPSTVTVYLVRHASLELLASLIKGGQLKPKEIRKVWQQRFVTDLRRYQDLMTILPKDLWVFAMRSPAVWDQIDVLEQLAAAGVDFNRAIGPTGEPPIHFAVQSGRKEAVRWLIDHGADPKQKDDYGRDAFDWNENVGDYDCSAALRGEPEPVDAEASAPTALPSDIPGVDVLNKAAAELPEGIDLMIRAQIKSPPVSRTEKAFFQECHYTLSMAVGNRQVTFNHITLPSQDYLYAEAWPSTLFLAVLRWPELTPLWDTVEVVQLDREQARKKRGYQPQPRPELIDAARAALELGFDPQQAASRKVRLRQR